MTDLNNRLAKIGLKKKKEEEDLGLPGVWGWLWINIIQM